MESWDTFLQVCFGYNNGEIQDAVRYTRLLKEKTKLKEKTCMAASIYYISCMNSEYIKQKDICHKLEVSETSLRLAYKKLVKLTEKERDKL